MSSTPPKRDMPVTDANENTADAVVASKSIDPHSDIALAISSVAASDGPLPEVSQDAYISDILPTMIRKFQTTPGINAKGMLPAKVLWCSIRPVLISPLGRLARENAMGRLPKYEKCWLVAVKTAIDTTVVVPPDLSRGKLGKYANQVFEAPLIEIPTDKGPPEVLQLIEVYHPAKWDWRYPYGSLATDYNLKRGAGLISLGDISSAVNFKLFKLQEYVTEYVKPAEAKYLWPYLTFGPRVDLGLEAGGGTAKILSDPDLDTDAFGIASRGDFLGELNYQAGIVGGAKGMKITSLYRSPIQQARVVQTNYNREKGEGGVAQADNYIRSLYGNWLGCGKTNRGTAGTFGGALPDTPDSSRCADMIALLKASDQSVPNGRLGKLSAMRRLWEAGSLKGHLSGRDLDISFKGAAKKGILQALSKTAAKLKNDRGANTSIHIEADHFHVSVKTSGGSAGSGFSLRIDNSVVLKMTAKDVDFDWIYEIPTWLDLNSADSRIINNLNAKIREQGVVDNEPSVGR